jgi:5-oxoprolinase (ATP-hydrolysing) subunit A
MQTIDLNCDMGEGMPNDEALMKLISSANIACGAHAGDEDTMKRTITRAMKYGVAIGAHPSYPDRENFGRKDLLGSELNLQQVELSVRRQIEKMIEICGRQGCKLHHVKPHGALYNRAVKDQALSECLARIIADFDTALVFYGLSGSIMATAAKNFKLKFKHEVFADRGYADDGSLLSRSLPGALLDPDKALQQALQMITEETVTSSSGKKLPVIADTICVHGDGPHALEIATQLREGLAANQIQIHVGNTANE